MFLTIKKFFLDKQIQTIFFLFIVWRILLSLVEYFGLSHFAIVSNFYGTIEVDQLKAWANWDGGHYIGIAEHGYAYLVQHAFFPLYPLLVKIVSFFTLGNYFWAGVIVSNVFLLGFLIVFYKLARHFFSEETAIRAVFFVLIFPLSFFLTAVYSESVYLFFSAVALYFALKKQWLFGGIAAIFVTATRFVGIFLILALLFEYLNSLNFQIKKVTPNILVILIGFLGLISYIVYLYFVTGDPLAFVHVQIHWQRSTDMANPLIVLLENSYFLIHDPNRFFILFANLDYFYTVLFLILSIFVFFKVRKSLGIYCLLVTIFPLLSNSLVSMPRYCLAAFPVFLLLAKWGEHKWIDYVITMFSLMFLGMLLVLFITGAWVA